MATFGVSPDKEQALAERMEKLGIHESDIVEKFIRSGGHGGQRIYFEPPDVGENAACGLRRRFASGPPVLLRTADGENQERSGPTGGVEQPLARCSIVSGLVEDQLRKPVWGIVFPERVPDLSRHKRLIRGLEDVNASILARGEWGHRAWIPVEERKPCGQTHAPGRKR